MKPDYKNWVPKGMIASFAAGAGVALVLFLIFGVCGAFVGGVLRWFLAGLFGAAALVLIGFTIYCVVWYRAFDYGGKRQLSRAIVEGTAKYVDLPEGGRGLDVGCGSGALTIAVAKRNPHASVLGVDRWGFEYASFNKQLCESNARAEGVQNGSFDAVTSNYVYHNVSSKDRQALLLETLRVLKKGGSFAIHDLFSRGNYGDMDAFIARLKEQGYEQLELIDTTQGLFMGPREAKWLMLGSSKLLMGKK